MRKLTPTLTQSGLLAVLLQRQRYKISQLARSRAQREHMRGCPLEYPHLAVANAYGDARHNIHYRVSLTTQPSVSSIS
jgi:hypothetical protein